jgi:myo-inositol-1(or 4)-monophosphatase
VGQDGQVKIISQQYRAARTDVEIASLTAVIAGNAALRYFGYASDSRNGEPMVEAEVKSGPDDLVSEADRAAEAAAVETLQEHRPGDGYLGEEGSRSDGAPANGRRWLIDGIDGTFNFLHGVPYWCSAVCLMDEHGPAASAVWDPVAEMLTVAGRGLGASSSGGTLSPSLDRGLERLSLVTYLHPDTLSDASVSAPLARVMRACATVRVMGSGSLDLVQVAQGRAGVWLQHDVKDWDWWPGALIVREAGGESQQWSVGGHSWSAAGGPQAVGEVLAELTS